MNLIFCLIPLMLITVDAQDLCSTFVESGDKTFIYSVDNERLFIFIDIYYWIVSENGNKLSFKKSERVADGSQKVSTKTMDTLFYAAIKYMGAFVYYDVRFDHNSSLYLICWTHRIRDKEWIIRSGISNTITISSLTRVSMHSKRMERIQSRVVSIGSDTQNSLSMTSDIRSVFPLIIKSQDKWMSCFWS